MCLTVYYFRMAGRDPFMHLEWEDIDFDDFLDHVTQLLIETNWYNNAAYAPGTTINQARNMRMMGYDAGVFEATMLRPPNTNLRDWREYYLFVLIARYGDFSLNI